MTYTDEYISEIRSHSMDASFLYGKTICLSGATGLIGSFLIDYLLLDPSYDGKIIALVRNRAKAEERFSRFLKDPRLVLKECSLTEEILLPEPVDYMLHLASITDPLNYSLHPVETMTTNFLGLKNMLDAAKGKNAKFLFTSSCEVYGTASGLKLKESDYGYVDILNPRSCYNEAKKSCETLCVSYHKEFGTDIVIARLSRVYGPTMKLSDTKALSQFINKGLNKENIVLKSKGEQLFNYTYVSDAVKGILLLLRNNHQSVSYNLTSAELVPLKDIARMVADMNGTDVVFELPSDVEQKGYSKATVSSMDTSLFENEFGYVPDTPLKEGLERTFRVLENRK